MISEDFKSGVHMRRMNISRKNYKLIVKNDSIGKTRPGEIILITLLVIVGFVMTEFIINHLIFTGALQRFIMRIGFQIQFFVLIYLFFNSRDNSRRVRVLEKCFMREPKGRIKKYVIGKKVKKVNGR